PGLKSLNAPLADMPTAAERKRLQGCASVDLYYGTETREPNRKDARLCAFIERDGHDDGQAISGALILSAIYANGDGIARRPNLAKHFACETGEQTDRVVQTIDEAAQSHKHLDVCDLTTGFPTSDLCFGYQYGGDLARITREGNARVAGWPAAQ